MDQGCRFFQLPLFGKAPMPDADSWTQIVRLNTERKRESRRGSCLIFLFEAQLLIGFEMIMWIWLGALGHFRVFVSTFILDVCEYDSRSTEYGA